MQQREGRGLHRRALLKLAGAASVGGGVAAGVESNPSLAPVGRAAATSHIVESFENTDLSTDYSFEGGSWGYRSTFRAGTGQHPVMQYVAPGSTLSVNEVEDAFSSPLFPSSLAPV